MHAVQRGGDAYLSSATLRGKFALRACITNFRTTRADIDQTLEIIREPPQSLIRSSERQVDFVLKMKPAKQSFEHEMRVALELAREAGAAILDFYDGPLDIQQKPGADDREPSRRLTKWPMN